MEAELKPKGRRRKSRFDVGPASAEPRLAEVDVRLSSDTSDFGPTATSPFGPTSTHLKIEYCEPDIDSRIKPDPDHVDQNGNSFDPRSAVLGNGHRLPLAQFGTGGPSYKCQL